MALQQSKSVSLGDSIKRGNMKFKCKKNTVLSLFFYFLIISDSSKNIMFTYSLQLEGNSPTKVRQSTREQWLWKKKQANSKMSHSRSISEKKNSL